MPTIHLDDDPDTSCDTCRNIYHPSPREGMLERIAIDIYEVAPTIALAAEYVSMGAGPHAEPSADAPIYEFTEAELWAAYDKIKEELDDPADWGASLMRAQVDGQREWHDA